MPTHFKGNREQTLALDTFVKLMRCSDSVNARLSKERDDADLTIGQFGVLEALFHLGPMCLTALAGKLLRSGGNLTLVVRNLEKRKLVRRVQEADDRRYVTIHLTPKGATFIEKIFREHARSITAVIGVLQPAEQEELGRLCRKLGLAAR